MKLLFVLLGGAIGAGLRYVISEFFSSQTSPIHLGILSVNVVGSLLIGVFFAWTSTAEISLYLRSFIVLGLLGAFTTFSTYSWEVVLLIQSGETLHAVSAVLLHNAVSIFAAYSAYQLSLRVF